MGTHRIRFAALACAGTLLLLTVGVAPAVSATATATASAAASTAEDCRTIPVEADEPLSSGLARSTFGVDGTGATIGIMSDSYALATAVTTPEDDIADGLLPGPGNPCGRETPVEVLVEGSEGADEGRAMAQLVHGIAPGARILFAADGDDVHSAAQSVLALAEAGATIIVDDVSPAGELAFQRSELSSAIEQVRSEYSVSYLTSAGNETVVGAGDTASEGRPIGGWRTTAYRGTECPEWVEPTDGEAVDCLDFDPGEGYDPTDTLAIDAGDSPTFILQWGEPVDGLVSDFELQLYRTGDGEPVAVGDAYWRDTARPIVELDLGTTIEEGDYDLVVVRLAAPEGAEAGSGPAVWIGQTTNTNVILSAEYDTSAGDDVVGPVTYGHQSDGSSLTVGTATWDTPEVIADTQSIGPGTLLFGPVDPESGVPAAALEAPETVDAPALVSVDGTRTSFFGWDEEEDGETVYRFHGTSAAAPNAAAVLALAFEWAPEAGAAAIEQAALDTARPLENPYAEFGFADASVVGAGLLDAYALLESFGAPPAPAPEPTGSGDASGDDLADTGAATAGLVAAVAAAVVVLAAGVVVVVLVRRRARAAGGSSDGPDGAER
ncbi:S8 family serine peptidase [Herbiconiux moechotypicola]|uniref:Peptidase S8/S53 domain-containing protein n=1 Tax=Herbiconiux moechotypicola TaxID=637393 RepID=A0ABN3DQE5_9MICO|nr:S8 family serine peptidase [Herbiconiux moechotypicola]MCS5731750.1 S8 family serine peptidase [Herbiconiux moechotypicola]